MSEYEKIEEFSRAPQSADYLMAGSASIWGIPLPPPELRLYDESDDDHLNGGRTTTRISSEP